MLDPLIQQDLIEKGRRFTMGYRLDDLYNEDFESDQMLKRPQPPLTKAPMRPEAAPRAADASAAFAETEPPV